MALRTDVERYLQTTLRDLSGDFEYKSVGVRYELKSGQAWTRGTTLLSQPLQVSQCSGAGYRQRGVFQVDLFHPVRDRNTQPLTDKADEVSGGFYPRHNQGVIKMFGNDCLILDRLPNTTAIRDGEESFVSLSVEIYFRIETAPV